MPNIVVLEKGCWVAGKASDIRVSLTISYACDRSAIFSFHVNQISGITSNADWVRLIFHAVRYSSSDGLTFICLNKIPLFASNTGRSTWVVLTVAQLGCYLKAIIWISLY